MFMFQKKHYKIHFLKPDQYFIKDEGVLYTVLGSCVAVILWDKEKKIASMAHYRMYKDVYAKSIYVSGEVLLNKMYEEIFNYGVEKNNLIAFVLGGVVGKNEMSEKISKDNLDNAIKFLKDKGIKNREIGTASKEGIRVRFYIDTGKLVIIEI